MDIRGALKGQYHAGIAMLRQCVELCPEDIWTSGKHPRNYWRIAYHAAFYTHLYLGQGEESFEPWPKARESCRMLWEEPGVLEPYTKADILAYLDHINATVDETLDKVDLDSSETGFSWYKSMSKLDHEVMNLRHLQGHVGQLSEILMANGIETDWVGRGPTNQQ